MPKKKKEEELVATPPEDDLAEVVLEDIDPVKDAADYVMATEEADLADERAEIIPDVALEEADAPADVADVLSEIAAPEKEPSEIATPKKGTRKAKEMPGEAAAEIPGEEAMETAGAEAISPEPAEEAIPAAKPEKHKDEINIRSRQVQTLERAQQVKAYNGESIRPMDADGLKMVTPLEKIRKDIMDITQAAYSYSRKTKTGQMIRGNVGLAKNYRIGDRNIPCLEVFHGLVKIVVPIHLMTRLGMEENLDDLTMRQLNTLTNARLGSEVDLFIISFNEETKTAVGNRVEALDAIRRASFSGRNPVRAGDIVEGRITFVTNTRVGVEAVGCEAALKASDCLWSRASSLRENFETGKRVPVRITAIEKDGSVSMSIKEGMPDMRQYYLEQLHPGARAVGYVVQVVSRGIFVRLMNMEFDCFCPPPTEFMTPEVGRKVSLVIRNIDESTGHVFGRIVHTW